MTKGEMALIDEKFKGLASLVNAQFINVQEKLDKIEVQTTKTNGRVTELEKKEFLHVIECPQAPKIRVLEDNQLTAKVVKKWIITSVGIAGTITGIIFAIVKLFF